MTPGQTIAEYQAHKANRATWDARWQRIMEWNLPHKAYITDKQEPTPSLQYRSNLHDTKAIEAAEVMTSAHMSYITPLNENWLSYAPPAEMSGDDSNEEAASYFKKCSEVAMAEISRSNFYTVMHAVYKDRTIPGTGCVLLTSGKKNTLNFKYVPIGNYCFTEDEDNLADSLFREYQLPLSVIVKKFGEENLGVKLAAAWAEVGAKPENATQKYPILHVVREREKRDAKKEDQLNKPYEDLNICLTDKVYLQEGGFDEFPAMVSRYEKWGDHEWGFAPSFNALPNTLSANYIMQILKTLGEVAAMPRVLQLAGEKRQVDLRAGGRTFVSKEAAAMGYPKEWGTSGRFDIGMAILEQEHASIEQFYHVPLFRMFSTIDKQMTATEVAAREREKLLMFAPSFTQFVTDMTPLMLRVFSMLARAGKFPDPPESIIQQEQDGTAIIPNPEVVYQSRIALAIKALHAEGFDRVMMRAANVADIAPDVFDNFDLDRIFRDLSRNEGMPEKWIRAKELVDELRAARAEAQVQAEQAALAEQMAGTVQKLGGVEGAEQAAELAEA